MNRTGRLALVPALVLLCTNATFGQLSDAVKKAPTPDNAAIQKHVDAAIKNLTSDDAEKQAKGRDDLAGGAVLGDATAQPSAAFLDAYAAAVGKALTPLAAHEDMRVRLNAAIANARIAERVGNTRLADVTVRFMNDKTSAVALWGIKAARAMLMSALAQGGKQPILQAMPQAVQRFVFGPIVTEVYDALSLNIIIANPKPAPNVIKGAIPEMLRVFRVRVNGYGGGVPPDPAIDNVASEFLSFGPVWQQMTAPQRVEAVQAMIDLLTFAAQFAQLMEGEERQTLLPVFKRTGAALQVVGDALKNDKVSTAAKEVARISTGMDGSEITTKTIALAAALQAAVPGVKPTPELQLNPPDAAAAGTETPPADAPPANNGKAPPPNGGAAGNGGAPPARGQPKSAAPAADTDDAQTAGDAAAPARQGSPDAPAAPRAPARPSR